MAQYAEDKAKRKVSSLMNAVMAVFIVCASLFYLSTIEVFIPQLLDAKDNMGLRFLVTLPAIVLDTFSIWLLIKPEFIEV